MLKTFENIVYTCTYLHLIELMLDFKFLTWDIKAKMKNDKNWYIFWSIFFEFFSLNFVRQTWCCRNDCTNFFLLELSLIWKKNWLSFWSYLITDYNVWWLMRYLIHFDLFGHGKWSAVFPPWPTWSLVFSVPISWELISALLTTVQW